MSSHCESLADFKRFVEQYGEVMDFWDVRGAYTVISLDGTRITINQATKGNEIEDIGEIGFFPGDLDRLIKNLTTLRERLSEFIEDDPNEEGK